MSRRAAEKLISEGRVLLNGEVVELGQKADLDFDKITVNGETIRKPEKHVYVMLNKPKGYVTTMKDDMGRKNVSELVNGIPQRVYPVGRLDMFSEGLLIMTNDGELAEKLMHPSSEIKKVYSVHVRGNENIRNQIAGLKRPIEIDGRRTSCAGVLMLERTNNDAFLEITISEGRNRQIRRLCEREDLKVVELKRISEGGINIGDLPTGKWRYLTNDEVALLKK